MHALTENNGRTEMAYAGETPWHGLGQKLEAGRSIDEWVVAAGMDWRIKRSKVRYFADAAGAQQLEIPEQHVLFRNDTKAPLGIVSERFKVVQPREIVEFFRDLTEGAGFSMETAGTLFGGRRFWALASIGDSAIIRNPVDVVGGYLLLCTGTDGTLATTGKFTTVRVVCNNTLSMAIGKHLGRAAKITHRSVFDPARMKDQLGIAHDEFSEWVKTMRLLANEPVGVSSAEQYVFQLLSDKDWHKATKEEVENTMETSGFKKIMSLFNGQGRGANMAGVQGTAWGLTNAVSEYVDHHIRARTTDNRIDSAWFGNGDKLKTNIVDMLVNA